MDDEWNTFRSFKRKSYDAPLLSRWMVTALQLTKLAIFISVNGFLLLASAVSKLFVVTLSTNLLPPRRSTDIFTRKCARYAVHRTQRALAATHLSLFAIQALPDVVNFILTLRRIFKGERPGRVCQSIVILESLRALGLCLLAFYVFPQLDAARGVALMSSFMLLPCLQRALSALSTSLKPSHNFRQRFRSAFLSTRFIVATLLLLSTTYLWMILKTPFAKNLWMLPLGVFLSAIGFWESWTNPSQAGSMFSTLYQLKYGVRKMNVATRLVVCVSRILIALVVMLNASSNIVKPASYFKLLTTFSLQKHDSRLLCAALALCCVHSLLRACCRLLAAMKMNPPSLLHPMTLSSLIAYALVSHVCSAPSCFIARPLARLSLRLSCDDWQLDTGDWIFCALWLAIAAVFGCLFARQEQFSPSDEVIESMSPVVNGFAVEQSLVVFEHSLTKLEHELRLESDSDLPQRDGNNGRVRNDEVGRNVTVFACATMWHETANEMTQMMRSVLKLDEERALRARVNKSDDLKFNLEGHIFFDDAWEVQTENGRSERVPNEFFRTFFELLNEMTGEGVDENGKMKTRVMVNTPYGGRLVVRLPAGTLLFVHLKDKKLIRHKKRWSQVMYMYYLLGHRIMDSALSVEDKQQMSDNTYILAMDGDSKFEPDAMIRLLTLMNDKRDIGCACGRIHPIGSGIMVWYQKFEYAIAHWFQKAAEHVFGCVLCAPGCFSLFRASALMDDNIMHKYTKTATEPRQFVQYDQGEDRWLSTLLLKQGYRIEYAAASDAETYAPEGFEEFFNQRRRWTPSSVANTIDLLMDYKAAIEKNKSISLAYIAYQFIVIVFSMLGPAIMFSMLVFAQVAAFGAETSQVMFLNATPILVFIFLCFTTESNVQLFYAKMLSIVYAFVMLAVLVATTSQIVLETIVSPTSMFIVAMVLIFFFAACLHPREFGNILYGTVFFLMIPSTYVLLTLYSLINLNVINWGTREAVAKATGSAESSSPLVKWCRKLKGPLMAVLTFCRARPADSFIELERKVEELQRKIELGQNGSAEGTLSDGTSEGDKPQNSSVAAASKSEEAPIKKEEPETKSVRSEYGWMNLEYLKVCERGRIKATETHFWQQLIDVYLKPIVSSTDEQREVAEGLISLRNSVAFSILIVNCLLALAIYLLQKHKNVLSIRWTPYENFKWTKMNEMNGQFEETTEALKIDPLGIAIILFLMGILVVQTIGLLLHRFNTLIGALQEVDHAAPTVTNTKHDDARILNAARAMLDTSFVQTSHATDGYTRTNRDLNADGRNERSTQLARRMKSALAPV